MVRILTYSLLIVLHVSPLFAQVGGNHAFAFLNLSNSSKVSALGGSAIGYGDQLALASLNPAFLTDTLHGALSFQHQFLFAGIQHGYAGYAHQLKQQDLMLHAGVQYVFYGEFDAFDEFGIEQGVAKASDLAVIFGTSYSPYEKLTVGANLKLITSQLDVYNATALAFDLGAHYQASPQGAILSLVLRNAGYQIGRFGSERESLPVDLQIGISKRLKYLPFRFGIIAHQLNNWNLLYDNPTQESGFLFGIQQDLEPSGFDNFMRHFIFNGEFLLGRNDVFRLRFGYNHQRKQELSVNNFRTLTGFSGGFGVRIKGLTFDYAVSKVHFAGSTHHLGISTNLARFKGTGIL